MRQLEIFLGVPSTIVIRKKKQFKLISGIKFAVYKDDE